MKKIDFHRSLLPRPVFAMAHRKLAVESMTQILGDTGWNFMGCHGTLLGT